MACSSPVMLSTLAVVVFLAGASPAPATAEQEVEAFAKELFDALRRHDTGALERFLTDGFTFVHSTGGLETKKTYIDWNMTVPTSEGPRDEPVREHLEVYDGHTAVATVRS